ncbi:unnamed protein product [Mucor hiemalis]
MNNRQSDYLNNYFDYNGIQRSNESNMDLESENDEENFEVERILSHRKFKKRMKFLIMSGCPPKRSHYLTCPFVETEVSTLVLSLPDEFPIDEDYDDDGVPTTHLLDRLLNHLPTKLNTTIDTHWETSWPLMLKWINNIDFASHPDGSFDDDYASGDLYRHYVEAQLRNK